MKRKVLFVTSHPIQYQVPVFQRLASTTELDFKVLFAMLPEARVQGAGFGIDFKWDLPLLDGYSYQVLKNIASTPGVTHFAGCDTPDVYSVIHHERPDAVVVNGWVVKSCLQTLWACKRLAIPCLVRGEANDLRKRPAWKRTAQKALLRQFAAALYIGWANYQFYVARGVSEERLHPSLYCVDNERFARTASDLSDQRQALRIGWGMGDDRTCFLFCGKLEHKKHPLGLLEAFFLASQQSSQLHLLMVGDGPLRRDCEHFANEHRLPVTFTGFLNQTDIVKAYVASDCLVLPSDARETWGLVVNEAMACGLPAIVSDQVGCAADLISPGITGEVFPSGKWNVLAETLLSASQSCDRLNTMGVKAARKVAPYSPEASANGIRQAVLAITS